MEAENQYGNDGYGDDGRSEGCGSVVFVQNLQWWTTDVQLETACSHYGTIQNIKFLEDKACGKSRGMAIVEYIEPSAADACIAGLNGQELNGRPCKVQQHIQKSQQQQHQPQYGQQQQYGQQHGGRGVGGGGGYYKGGRGGGGGGGGGYPYHGGRGGPPGGGGGGGMPPPYQQMPPQGGMYPPPPFQR